MADSFEKVDEIIPERASEAIEKMLAEAIND